MTDEELADMDGEVAKLSRQFGPFAEVTMAARFAAERARVKESKRRWMEARG